MLAATARAFAAGTLAEGLAPVGALLPGPANPLPVVTAGPGRPSGQVDPHVDAALGSVAGPPGSASAGAGCPSQLRAPAGGPRGGAAYTTE